MPEAPPNLPGTLSRPDAQQIIDALNVRLWEVEKGVSALGSAPIKGSVGSTGTIVVGSGFSVVHTGTGIYTITLATELATNGLIFAFSTEQNRVMRASTGIAKKVFVINPVSLGEVAADTAFNFVIYPT